jgi:hypothetical protein
MFEIVNGVVKELTNIKRMVIQNSMGNMSMSMVESNPYYKTNPAILLKPEDLYTNTEPTYTENDMSEYDESSDEDEYIDSDEEDTYVEEEWVEDKREPTNVDTTENIKIINYNDVDTLESVETMDVPESDVSSEDDIPNEPELIVSEDVEIPIVIKLDEEEEEEEKEEEEKEEEPIEEVVTDEIEQTPVPSIKEKEESYKRLNVNQLKAIVVSKGITTDTSKLKKNDLIKLLENFE